MLNVIEVIGDDAGSFLQSQLTGDILKLKNNHSLFTAYCNSQGRVIATMRVIKIQTESDINQKLNYRILLYDELVEKVLKTLQKFVLRSKVGLSISSENQIIKNELDQFLNIDEWLGAECINYRVWINLDTSEKYTPQMLGLDKNSGISFTKGCYPGQEVVARTHYLGKAKRALALIYLENLDLFQQLSRGIKIIDQNKSEVGEILQYGICNNQIIILISINTTANQSTLNIDSLNGKIKLERIDFQL